MQPMTGSSQEWAQGSLRILPPSDLLQLLARRGFTGRLALILASTPRRVVAVHLERGRPVLVVGTGLHHTANAEGRAYRGRQVLLEALGWTVGTFRIDPLERALPQGAEAQELGAVDELLLAARERQRTWPALLRQLPGRLDEVTVVPGELARLPDDPVQQAVLQVLDGPTPLPEACLRSGVDEHVAIQALLDLARDHAVRLSSGEPRGAPVAPETIRTARDLALTLAPSATSGLTFKITVLSWDARTCFRTVEALLGRFRPPPEDVDSRPQYQILHEEAPLGDGLRLEVLAFRADVFEPALAAPLVRNCHLFLLVTDLDAGHVWGAERPLVERIQEIREMFSQAAAAARITVGAAAVTDPGVDILIPELARFASWSEVERPGFLDRLLADLARRLGVFTEAGSGPHGRPGG